MEIFTTMATYIGFLLGFLVRFLCYFRKASGKSLPSLRKLRKPQTQTSRYINEDIWIEIFLKLPVKSVSRIRCVSKSWLSLTTSPNFIKAHFNLSPDRIISAPDSISIPNYIVSALHNADVDPDMWEKFRYCGAFGSDTDLFTYSHVVGICNGLICIHRHPCDIILWNPTTGRFRILPPSGTECFKECDHYGFGYNRLNDDYKVVEITTVLKVYSSLENTWRIILDCASLNADVIFDGPLGIFANGALHWVVHYQDEPNIRAIFALDMATEVCNFIGVGTPCNKYEYGGNAIKNVVLGASLDRLWISYNFKDYLEIWILSEKPVSGWSKFLCVKAQSWVYDPMTTKPLHILEDGCAFIMYDSNPLFKNLGGLRIYKPPEFDMDHFYSYLISTEAFIYRESLAIP